MAIATAFLAHTHRALWPKPVFSKLSGLAEEMPRQMKKDRR